jgi:hypothetical protein
MPRMVSNDAPGTGRDKPGSVTPSGTLRPGRRTNGRLRQAAPGARLQRAAWAYLGATSVTDIHGPSAARSCPPDEPKGRVSLDQGGYQRLTLMPGQQLLVSGQRLSDHCQARLSRGYAPCPAASAMCSGSSSTGHGFERESQALTVLRAIPGTLGVPPRLLRPPAGDGDAAPR